MSKSIKYADFISLRDKLATDVPSRLNLSSNAQMVFGKNYCKTLEDGRKETISERFAGMCLEVAGAEMKYLPEDMSYEKRLEKVSQKAGKFIDLMVSNTFRTNTPTNINFGRLKPQYDDLGNLTGYGYKSQLGSACFVIPVDDTFGKSTEDLGDGLLEAWVAQQLIHKGGGGTGMSMCRVRPKGSVIGYDPVVDKLSSIDWELDRGVSSGPDSFFEHFYNSGTDAVKQGNTRRGANMGVQRIDHQDFLDHLYAKFGRDKARLELRMKNFNLSLALTDGFMEAAKNNEMYTLYNPQRANPKIKKILKAKHKIEDSEVVRREDISTKSQFEKILEKNSKSPLSPVTTPNMYLDKDNETVINAYSGTPIGRVHNGLVYIEAKKVLGIISELARANGEPGVVFIDRMNEYNPLLFEEEIESTNPCGEQPLLPNEACNLGSINLGKFSKYSIFDNKSEIDLGEEVIRDRFTKIEERKDGRVGVMYFDWDNLDGAIETTVEFLDNVIDENDYPSPKIEERVNQTRKIGLGYMGVHDSMISMKMRYGSEESFEFAEALAQRLHQKSLEASCKLGEERGIFPA
ncbi:MAG TPA: hypothetical protein ENG87_03360, partial [Candidatus Pacearchaeota archaeon]|nr:hypothetical protein [Candidatus Pacearchaeota archaeon]